MEVILFIFTLVKFLLLGILGLIILTLLLLCIPIILEIEIEKIDKFIANINLKLLFNLIVGEVNVSQIKTTKQLKILNFVIVKDTEDNKKEKNKSLDIEEQKESEEINKKVGQTETGDSKSFSQNLNKHRDAIKLTIALFTKLYRTVETKLNSCDVKLYIEKPHEYGYGCAIVAATIPIRSNTINVELYNEKNNFEGKLNLGVKFIPIKAVGHVIQYLFKKPIRKLIINKLFRKDEEYGI